MAERTYCIACGVFRNDLDAMLAEGIVSAEVCYLEGGLHGEPDRLRSELIAAIAEAEASAPSGGWDRIVILYGLCGQGIIGIRSPSTPLTIPRVHDCISLFMGGADAYRRQFAKAPGTYYISAGWFEEQVEKAENSGRVHYPAHCMGDNDLSLETRFGQENADAVHRFLDSWKENYSRCVYIDTGSPDDERYRDYSRDLAAGNGWDFEVLSGSRGLIARCFAARESSDDVLIVPPGHEVYHDPASGTFSAGPREQRQEEEPVRTFVIPGKSGPAESSTRTGLGIDAGGTYTDAVIYDFETSSVRAKAKAPTTRWRYSEGIEEAVGLLPAELLAAVDIVSVSTTLVTNAIVENNRRPVGLLVMPAGGDTPGGTSDVPVSIIRGRMSISGEILEPVDEGEVKQLAAEMASRHHLQAFAVSGYGGANNPELELQVKSLVKEATGLDTCCGHEMSGKLNFSVRATTAMLNAGTIPIMEDFLAEMEKSLENLGIRAPMMVVRGDGTVMNRDFARTFPVQAALSGPAASMAGAMFLTGLEDAVVVDVGGTTSDIGLLREGRVAVRSDGAQIGDWATHVEAVDMLTIGLGGDSEILFEDGNWILGPRRVAPLCRLFSDRPDPARKNLLDRMEKLRKDRSRLAGSSRPAQVLVRTGKEPDFPLSAREKSIWDALEEGPDTLQGIAEATGLVSWKLLHTKRMESSACLLRHGLTPTDLFLINGRLETPGEKWDTGLAGTGAEILGDITGAGPGDLLARTEDSVAGKLGEGFLRRIIGGDSGGNPERETILGPGNDFLEISPRLNRPVVALGAPAGLMTGDAVGLFGSEPVLCENGDVANAVGAVTSRISVTMKASVVPSDNGAFRVLGLEGETGLREDFDEAEQACIDSLGTAIRARARAAGTSTDEITMTVKTDSALTGEGSRLFVARHYKATITGSPDLV